MNLRQLGITGALAAILALPATAQTTQTSPGKPGSPVMTPTPGTSTTAPASPNAATPSARSPVTPGVPAPSARSPAQSSSTLVDINSASSDDLDALPGIGKARGEAIIKNRPYKGKDDLLNRRIIPPDVYKGIADKIIARQG